MIRVDEDRVAAMRRSDLYEEDGFRLERGLVIFSRVLVRLFLFLAGLAALQWFFGPGGIQSW